MILTISIVDTKKAGDKHAGSYFLEIPDFPATNDPARWNLAICTYREKDESQVRPFLGRLMSRIEMESAMDCVDGLGNPIPRRKSHES